MANIKQTSKAQSGLLYVASGLVLTMGLILFFLSDNTQTFFAWTIGVPLTAAFLGGGYLASFILEFMAARERTWARSRIAVPAVLLFTSVTFVVTLLHLDKFHLNSENPITVMVTWAWILVYAIVPFLMAVIYVQQMRSGGENPPRQHPLPLWMKLMLGGQALLMLGLGVGMFFLPEVFAPLWAWELTPLTARAIAAWLLGLGIAAAHSVLEDDWVRLRPAVVSYALYGILQVINLLRYPSAAGLDWASAKTWAYVAFIASILLVGVVGTWLSQKHYRQES